MSGRHFSIEHALGWGYNPARDPPFCPVQPEECVGLSDDFLR